jgi:Peptidase_C39 like family
MKKCLTLLFCLFFSCLCVKIAEAQPTKPITPGQYAYLEIMDEHESTLLGLPTCVAMTLNFFGADSQWTAMRVGSAMGLNFDAERKSSGMVKRMGNENTDLFNGISFEQIQTGIKKMGYTWDRWDWPDDSAGFRHALDAIEQSLDARNPVLIDELIQYPSKSLGRREGHQALLAFGYDEKAGELLVMDPAASFPGKRHIPFDELRTIWHRGGHYNALFTAPAGKLPTGHKE